MQLPFSPAEFFDLLAAYNTSLWPAAVALWIVSALAAASLASSRPRHDRWIGGLLAVHWAWSALAYHVAFFTRINPAAWSFAAAFVAQAALLLWSGVIRGNLVFGRSRTMWTPMGWSLIGYALLYPAITAIEHGSIVRVPTFGLPCPTTIFTAGVLLLGPRPRPALTLVPIAWSVIGGSAAFLLGVGADYALPVAGVALAIATAQQAITRPSPVASRANKAVG